MRLFVISHYCVAVTTISYIVKDVLAKTTEDVLMPSSYCDGATIEVDAAHVYGIRDTLRSHCTITLKADLDNFMIGFGHVKLLCGQYIKLYFDKNNKGKPDKEFDCKTQASELNEFLFTPDRYLTILFEKPLGKQKYNFSIIATSYESGFFCNFDQLDCIYSGKEICIDNDLRCDGVKNCPDARDEEFCSVPRCFGSCRFSHDSLPGEEEREDTLPIGILITIVVLSVLTFTGVIIGLICCCRRRKQNRGLIIRPPQTQQSVQSGATPVASPVVYFPAGSQVSSPLVQPNVGSQPPAVASPGGYHPVPVLPPSGSAGESVPPPPAPYNPAFGPPQASPVSELPPPYTTTQTVASAPPLDTST